MKYLRLYADVDGESHVEEMQAEFDMQQYAPPAPAFGISAANDAARFVYVNFPAGWTSGFHKTPRRQMFVVLSGHLVGKRAMAPSWTCIPATWCSWKTQQVKDIPLEQWAVPKFTQ